MHRNEMLFRKKCLVNGQTASARLEELFDEDLMRPRDVVSAFIWVEVIGMDDQAYGSYRRVTRDQLKGRDYLVQWCDYKPGILVLDSSFNPRGSVWSNPL